MEMDEVLCEVGTEILRMIEIISVLQMVNIYSKSFKYFCIILNCLFDFKQFILY